MTLDWPEVRARIEALGLGADDVLLLGSGPMLAHGLVDSIGDIDLVARGRAWERAASLGDVSTGLHGDRIVRLAGDVEVFSGWHGRSTEEVFDRAERVDGVLVGSLEEVLAFKLALGRPKDAAHVEILKAALRR